MPTSELIVARRFNGPPDSGNGGFVAGRLAAFLPAGSTVRVTLRAPVPLETALSVTETAAGLVLLDGQRLIAEADRVDAAQLGAAVPPVDVAQARSAMTRFDGRADHPFPTCFACGTGRPDADGLGLFAGAVADRLGRPDPTRTATLFIARPDLGAADDGCRSATTIGAEIVWTVLDCPGGWTIGLPGRPAVLGRMTAAIRDVPAVGETCVVVGQLDERRGRKAFTRTCAYGADGRELGRATAVWIEISRG